MRIMLFRLFVESKRVIAYVFTLLLVISLLLALVILHAPESVLMIVAGAVPTTVASLAVLVHSVGKTDVAEAEAQGRSEGSGK